MASLPATAPGSPSRPASATSPVPLVPSLIALSEEPPADAASTASGPLSESIAGETDWPPVLLRIPDLDAPADEEPPTPASSAELHGLKEWATSEVGFWVLLACGALLALYLVAGGGSSSKPNSSISQPMNAANADAAPGSATSTTPIPVYRAPLAETPPAGTATPGGESFAGQRATSPEIEQESRQRPKASLTGRILKPTAR